MGKLKILRGEWKGTAKNPVKTEFEHLFAIDIVAPLTRLCKASAARLSMPPAKWDTNRNRALVAINVGEVWSEVSWLRYKAGDTVPHDTGVSFETAAQDYTTGTSRSPNGAANVLGTTAGKRHP